MNKIALIPSYEPDDKIIKLVNELSKNGYSLEFDTKLENNIGTVGELANKILEGSSW